MKRKKVTFEAVCWDGKPKTAEYLKKVLSDRSAFVQDGCFTFFGLGGITTACHGDWVVFLPGEERYSFVVEKDD